MNITQPLPHPDAYTYLTAYSVPDGEFLAQVVEFPSLSYLANTPETAEAGLKGIVHRTLIDLHESGGAIPQPRPRPVPQPAATHYPTFPIPTHHFAMPQYSTAPAQGVSQSVNVVVGGGYGYRRRGIGAGWHILHASLTALSCGIWAVVWIAHVLIDAHQQRG